MIDLPAERAYVDTLRTQWLAERSALHKTVAECARAKTTPAHNYWEAEHRAEQRFMMALKVLTVLEGV
jgi:hypothetical protein